MALGNDKGDSLFVKMVKSAKDLMTKPVREEAVAQFLHKKRLDKDLPNIAQLHEMIEKQHIEVRKLDKPPTGYDSSGKEVERLRTKEEHEAKNKANERLEKMLKAYDKALDGDMGDANNFVQQSAGKDKGTKEGQGESS